MVDFVLENMSFDIEIPGEPISEKDLSDLETKLGTRLPPQLRSYYLRWNGGIPLPSSTPEDKSVWVRLSWKEGAEAAHGGPATSFQGMYKINSSIPGTDFLDTWNDFKHRVPEDCLCFARDPGGSQFLIGIKEHNLGKIYFWERAYQANRNAGEVPSYDNIADVADSFVEFLLALREEPDPGETLDAWVQRVYSQ